MSKQGTFLCLSLIFLLSLSEIVQDLSHQLAVMNPARTRIYLDTRERESEKRRDSIFLKEIKGERKRVRERERKRERESETERERERKRDMPRG